MYKFPRLYDAFMIHLHTQWAAVVARPMYASFHHGGLGPFSGLPITSQTQMIDKQVSDQQTGSMLRCFFCYVFMLFGCHVKGLRGMHRVLTRVWVWWMWIHTGIIWLPALLSWFVSKVVNEAIPVRLTLINVFIFVQHHVNLPTGKTVEQ